MADRCDNCRRVAHPRAYRVTLLVDGVIVGQRDLCRACLTHGTDELAKPAPWLGIHQQLQIGGRV